MSLDDLLEQDNSSATSALPSGGSGNDDYDYKDYDLNVSWNTFFWGELCPTLAVYSLTMLLGIAGNSLIIFTIFRYRRMKSTTNVFLASLASADLLLILVCIPVKVAKLFSYTWTMGLFLCKMVHYMQSVSAICSVLTLTAMSVERYYAIVHPMKAKYICTISQARKIIIATWTASFFLAIPILFVQIQMTVGDRVKAHWCVRNWDDPPVWKLHELYMLFLILVVPTSVMAVTYSSICWEIWSVMQVRYHMTSGKENIKLETFSVSNSKQQRHLSFKTGTKDSPDDECVTVKQVIKMLVFIVVVFVICWGPMLIDNVLTAWGVLPYLRTGSLKYMATAFHLMAYFNSCVNPIVYGFMSKNFRESFHKALCRCCRGRPQRQLSMSQTRTTSFRCGGYDRSTIYLNHINHQQ